MDEMTVGEWICHGEGTGKRLQTMAEMAVSSRKSSLMGSLALGHGQP